MVSVYFSGSPVNTPQTPLDSAAYVWQRNWGERVAAAVEESSGKIGHFMYLAGESTVHGDSLDWQTFHPDWVSLKKAHAQVTPVFRMGSETVSLLRDGDLSTIAGGIAEELKLLRTEAAAHGVEIDGVQVDFDSPTSKIERYRMLIVELDKHIGDTELSITTLPTWMDSEDFEGLVQAADYFVLQVHSLVKPDRFEDEITLIEAQRLPHYFEQASATVVPFYIALPTYGYRYIFTPEGDFHGIIAEQRANPPGPGYRERRVLTDPEAMAQLVTALNDNPPEQCLGLVWFRLPVQGDRLNWSWATLQAVMDGRAPRVDVRVAIENPKEGLYEVWVENVGENTPHKPVQIAWPQTTTVKFSDTMNGYNWNEDGSSVSLSGPAPETGKRIRVAWYRTETTDAAIPDATVHPDTKEVR